MGKKDDDRRLHEERLQFVELYARWILSQPDQVWSREQNVIIDSMLESAVQLDPRTYMKIKNEKCDR